MVKLGKYGRTNHDQLVRVIKDTRDADRDYYISRGEAEEKFNNGDLIMVRVSNSGWDYAEKENM